MPRYRPTGGGRPPPAPVFLPLHLPPFPHLSTRFGTARRRQGRAMWARRSEPLTARTVLESETGGKGGFTEPPATATQHIPHAVRLRTSTRVGSPIFVSPPFALHS